LRTALSGLLRGREEADHEKRRGFDEGVKESGTASSSKGKEKAWQR